MQITMTALVVVAAAPFASAHVAAWTKGMYCLNGTEPGTDDQDTHTAVNPLYQQTKTDWWMQHDRGCDKFPPAGTDSLALPAGGVFTVELAVKRAFTTLSYLGMKATTWPDGQEHPEDWKEPTPGGCLPGAGGALHTHNKSTAAGTAWAISYNTDITKVTMENLAVFSVLEQKLATYEVPADLPACPKGGCYCAWLWIPDGCVDPSMYIANYRCHVTGAKIFGVKKVAAAKPPVYCADDSTKCVKGAKQTLAWSQLDGNNVNMPAGVSPGYNQKMGFKAGAQNDIFA